MSTDRKLSYKVPPTTITDKLLSQDARRSKALEDQKRRRAQKVDSCRQLDLFADLNLGPSDNEEGEVVREGVALFASMVGPSHQTDPSAVRGLLQPSEPPSKGGKRKGKKKQRNLKADKPNKWANKCMYAELLEMRDDDAWPLPGSAGDPLPDDLESGWVAVAPVPVGKRCLAVTHQSSGIVGVVPNTSLRSRVLGKSLMQPFPSNLPPQTVLDCILDPNWRDNGILHVLDVVQWKGQDIGDCEVPFRFWWRDTRLAELPRPIPPSNPAVPSSTTALHSLVLNTSCLDADAAAYHFPYPISFLPIPYHTNTALSYLTSQVIPLARSLRLISINVPAIPMPTEGTASTMEVDHPLPIPPMLTSMSVALESDGMLLYVSQASYEPGTSPLSSWIPITGYAEEYDDTGSGCQKGSNRPLDLFEQLVTRRLLNLKNNGISHTASVEVVMEG